MLSLKMHPVVSSTKDTNIECFNELLDVMVEEAIYNGWILQYSFVAAQTAFGVVRADEVCQFWPLEVSCTVGKEYSGQIKRVNHGNESALLLEPVVSCSS